MHVCIEVLAVVVDTLYDLIEAVANKALYWGRRIARHRRIIGAILRLWFRRPRRSKRANLRGELCLVGIYPNHGGGNAHQRRIRWRRTWRENQALRLHDPQTGEIDPLRWAVPRFEQIGANSGTGGSAFQAYNIPIDDEVLYGKIGAFGHLVHVSEIMDPS